MPRRPRPTAPPHDGAFVVKLDPPALGELPIAAREPNGLPVVKGKPRRQPPPLTGRPYYDTRSASPPPRREASSRSPPRRRPPTPPPPSRPTTPPRHAAAAADDAAWGDNIKPQELGEADPRAVEAAQVLWPPVDFVWPPDGVSLALPHSLLWDDCGRTVSASAGSARRFAQRRHLASLASTASSTAAPGGSASDSGSESSDDGGILDLRHWVRAPAPSLLLLLPPFHETNSSARPPPQALTDDDLEAVGASNAAAGTSLLLASCLGVTDAGVARLGRWPKLTALDVSFVGAGAVGDAALVGLAGAAPKLRSVDVRGSDVGARGVGALTAGCKHLAALRLARCPRVGDDALLAVRAGMVKFAALTWLDLAGCRHFGDDALLVVLKDGGKLKKVQLSEAVQVTDLALIGLRRADRASASMALAYLDLSGLPRLLDSTFTFVAEGCKRLTTLSIARCGLRVRDHGFERLARCAARLTALDISECRVLTSESVAAVLAEAPRLRRLVADGCTGLDGGAVVAAAQHCPDLEVLSVCGVPRVDDAALKAVGAMCEALLELAADAEMNIADVSRKTRIPRYGDAGICAVARGCHALRALSVAGAVRVSDVALR